MRVTFGAFGCLSLGHQCYSLACILFIVFFREKLSLSKSDKNRITISCDFATGQQEFHMYLGKNIYAYSISLSSTFMLDPM
jgi:hypothetical protein